MTLILCVTGLDPARVRLIGPESPGFDELARKLMGERIADIGLQLKPMLAIVANDSPQTIASLALVWHITHGDGRTSRFWGHTSFPETVCGDTWIAHHPDAISPGQRYLQANGIVLHGWGHLDQYFDQFLGQFVDQKNALLADAVELHIDLNAVIFADGRLVGADDESQLTDRFSTYVREKQEWYRGIITALDAGRSVDDAFSTVQAFVDEQMRRQRAGEMSALMRDPGAVWKHQAAFDAARWRRRFKDEEIPALLKAAIRLEPFVIIRQGAAPA